MSKKDRKRERERETGEGGLQNKEKNTRQVKSDTNKRVVASRHGLGMAEKREQEKEEEEEEVANKFELSLSLASFCLLLATTTDWTHKERERARGTKRTRDGDGDLERLGDTRCGSSLVLLPFSALLSGNSIKFSISAWLTHDMLWY